MGRSMLITLMLVSIFGIVFSSPVQPGPGYPQYPDESHIPKCMQTGGRNGLCLAYFPSYYYVPSKNTCESFIYGGCGGNENRFISFEACMAECGGYEATTQEFKLRKVEDENESVEEESQSAEEDICSLPAVMGSCRAAMPRFYFNGNDCENFMYGGCDGNENNFPSVEACRQRCGPKSSEESDSSPENDVSDEDSNSNSNSNETEN